MARPPKAGSNSSTLVSSALASSSMIRLAVNVVLSWASTVSYCHDDDTLIFVVAALVLKQHGAARAAAVTLYTWRSS
jgi:hypothetical protein